MRLIAFLIVLICCSSLADGVIQTVSGTTVQATYTVGGAITAPSVTITGASPGTVSLNDAAGNLRLRGGTNDNVYGTNVNGSTFLLTNGSITLLAGTRTFSHDSTHTVITNTATLTSSEWTSGSQKEWYNGATTITIDKTNGSIAALGNVSTSGGQFNGNAAGLTNYPFVSPSGYFSVPRAQGVNIFYETFDGNTTAFRNNWSADSNGSGTVTKAALVDTSHQGVAAMTLANVNVSRTGLQMDGTLANYTFGGGVWYLEWPMKYDSACTGSIKWNQGFLSARVDIMSGFGAYFQFSTNSANWQCVTRVNNTTLATTNTTSTAVGTGWQILGIKVDATASNVFFYVNGTAIATNVANIPTGISQTMGAYLGGYRPANDGSASQILYCDSFWSCFVPTTFP